MEYVHDPDFNNPDEWIITTNAGTASVANGVLTCTNWLGNVTTNIRRPRLGRHYVYDITVDDYSGGGLAVVQYGQNFPLWSPTLPVGRTTGEFYVSAPSVSLNIAVAFTPSNFVVSRVSLITMSSAQLFSDLTDYAALQALVGNGDSPATYRIYPAVMPQDPTYPAITYSLIVGTREVTLSDAGGAGVERNLFQITVWDDNLLTAESVMSTVLSALQNASFNYVPQAKRQVYESETKLFGVQYDFAQWYR